MNNRLDIATIGKPVGLKGDLRLHLHTDFPTQFSKGRSVQTANGNSLTIKSYDSNRSIISFVGYTSPENASVLTNQVLISSLEETKQSCKLNKNEYFWFEMIGCSVFDNDILIGTISEIDRFSGGDFLKIDTNASLIEQDMPKSFVLPFNDYFIGDVNIAAKTVQAKGAKEILEAS